jgi:hypothetical protein
MKLRLTGTFVLVLAIAALGSASAYAGNGQGNGNGKEDSAAAPASAASAQDRGNSANAQGQLKKDEAAEPTASAAAQVDPGAAQPGVKPANDTAHDTHAAASSEETKQYGNGKTAGQIAVQNGAGPSTILHGPGNSQPHKAAPCSGGHEVDVHALKGKMRPACGTQPPSPPHSTPDPGQVGDPAHGPNTPGNTPVSASSASSPSVPNTSASAKPVVSTTHVRVESANGVLSATGAIGGGTLPFTGFPLWVVALTAIALIAFGLMLRRRSAAPSL